MAGEVETFKVSLIADYRDLEKKIAKGRADLKKFDKEKKERARVRFTATMAGLQITLDKARKELRKFKKEGDKAGELKARINILGAQKNIKQVRGFLNELDKTTRKTTKGFFHLNGIVRDSIKAFGGLFILRKIKDMFTDMIGGVISFNSAFAGVRKTIEATPEEFAALSDEFRKLSLEIPIAIEELLRIGEAGGQFGIAKEELIDFAKVMAELGIATNVTAVDAAKSFARIKNVFNLTNKQIEKLSSSLVDLGNNMAADENEILLFANRLSGVSNVMGLTAQETFGIAAAFRSVGVEAESGGTAIQKALLKMNDIVLKGGKDLETFAKLSGKSVDEFVTTWKTKPVEAFKDFVKILSGSGTKAALVIEDLIGNNERLKRAFLSIAGAGDLLTDTINLSNKAYEKNTALTEEARKRYDTYAKRIQSLKNFFRDFSNEVGGPVTEALVSFGEAIVDILKGGKKLKEYAGWIKLIGVAIGTYLGIKVLGAVKTGVLAIAAAGTKAKIAMTSLATSGKGLAGLTAAISPILTIATITLPLLISAWIDAKFKAIEFDNAIKGLNKTLDELAEKSAISQPFVEKIKQAVAETTKLQDELFKTKHSWDMLYTQVDLKPLEKIRDLEKEIRVGNIDLRDSLIGLGEAWGVSGSETIEHLSQQGIAIENYVKDTESLNKITEEIIPLWSESFTKLSDKFGATFKFMEKAGHSWSESFSKTMELQRTDLGKAAKNITETYIKMAAESGEIGMAFMVGMNEGLSNEAIRKIIESTGIKNMDELIGVQLKKAVEAKDVGLMIPELIALGIDENTIEALRSSNNLMEDINSAINARIGSIQSSGFATGEAAILAIARGFAKHFPTLNKLAGQARNIISNLFPQTAAKVEGLTGRIKTFFGQATEQIKNLQKAQESLNKKQEESPYMPKAPGGGGGGGGGGSSAAAKAQKEDEKARKEAVKEAEKDLKDFNKLLDDTTKKSKTLSEKVKDFYSGIAKSIKEAIKEQKNLAKELKEFKAEETGEFVQELAERNAEILKNEEELQKEITELKKKANEEQTELDEKTLEKSEKERDKALKNEEKRLEKIDALQKKITLLELKRSEFNEETKQSTILSNAQRLKKAKEDLLKLQSTVYDTELNTISEIADQGDNLINVQKELIELQQERAKIAEIIARNTNLDKEAIDEILKKEEERSKLTEPERAELDLQKRLKQKEEEIKEEIAIQQRLIDMRKRFLEIIAGDEEKNEIENAKKKRELLQITSEKIYEDEEAFNKRLAELGFDNLSEDEKLELLKLASQEKNNTNEEKRLRRQQESLLEVKKDFIEIAEDLMTDSVDRQIDKVQELINKIREAQIEMSTIGGAAAAGLTEGGATYQINQNNNIQSDVDMDAAMNKIFLQKVSQ